MTIEIYVLWDNPYDQRVSDFKKAGKAVEKYGVKFCLLDITRGEYIGWRAFLQTLLQKVGVCLCTTGSWKEFEQTRRKFEARSLPAVVFYCTKSQKAVVVGRQAFQEKRTLEDISCFLFDMTRLLEDENLLGVDSERTIKARIGTFLKLGPSLMEDSINVITLKKTGR